MIADWRCSESGGRDDRLGRLDTGDELLAFAGEDAEVAFHLDAVPEGVGLAEEDTEAYGNGRSDGSLAEGRSIDRPRWHADGAGHGVLRNAHGLEVSSSRISSRVMGAFMARAGVVMASRKANDSITPPT